MSGRRSSSSSSFPNLRNTLTMVAPAQVADAVPNTVIDIATTTTPAADPSPPSPTQRRESAAASAGSKAQLPRLAISWQDVCFNVKIRNPATKQVDNKQILKSVSGEALPGELLVLMGPSGAGKSTLLDCISKRNGGCTGTIQVNGKPWSKSIAKHACYVMQDDLFYANLTVHEHLTLQAELRMGKHASLDDRTKRVEAVISELGLTKCRNTLIGDALVKGISGGQRKRLSFATELLTNPSLLFVDEPTSGLDSFMAETVILMMRDLARAGRTVIATIHQPSSELFGLFDRLYLLVDGATVYDGRASDSSGYFAGLGHQCPPFINPTDYFMKLLVVLDEQPEARERVDKLVAAWAATSTTAPSQDKSARKLVLGDLHQSDKDQDGDAAKANASIGVCQQVLVLCRRNWLRLVRDAIGFRARIGSTLFIAVMVGLIFLQLTLDQKGVQDFTGAIFFIAVNQMFSAANPEFITVPLEIPLVMREHNGGLYHVLTWYFAKNVSELPFQAFFPMLFVVPAYFMVGFGNDATVFFTFYLFILLVSSAATGLGIMVSCLAKRVDVAPIIGILFMLPFLLFGGLFLNSDSTPDYFIWLQKISPVKYGFHGLMRAFWSSVDSIACKTGQQCLASTGADVLRINSVKLHQLYVDALALVALNVGFRLLGGFFLWRKLGAGVTADKTSKKK